MLLKVLWRAYNEKERERSYQEAVCRRDGPTHGVSFKPTVDSGLNSALNCQFKIMHSNNFSPSYPIQTGDALQLGNITEQLRSGGFHYRNNIYLQGVCVSLFGKGCNSFGDPSLTADRNMD